MQLKTVNSPHHLKMTDGIFRSTGPSIMSVNILVDGKSISTQFAKSIEELDGKVEAASAKYPNIKVYDVV